MTMRPHSLHEIRPPEIASSQITWTTQVVTLGVGTGSRAGFINAVGFGAKEVDEGEAGGSGEGQVVGV